MLSLYQDLWKKGSRVISARIFETCGVDLHVFNNFAEQKIFFSHEISRQRIDIYPNTSPSYFLGENQSMNFVYANFDLNIQQRREYLRFLLMELFRVGKKGCILHYSPLYVSLVCACSRSFMANKPVVMLWTEPQSNELCIMPITRAEEIDWTSFKKKYSSMVMFHPNAPLFFHARYEWYSPVESNLQFLYPNGVVEEELMIEHAIQTSMHQQRDHILQMQQHRIHLEESF